MACAMEAPSFACPAEDGLIASATAAELARSRAAASLTASLSIVALVQPFRPLVSEQEQQTERCNHGRPVSRAAALASASDAFYEPNASQWHSQTWRVCLHLPAVVLEPVARPQRAAGPVLEIWAPTDSRCHPIAIAAACPHPPRRRRRLPTPAPAAAAPAPSSPAVTVLLHLSLRNTRCPAACSCSTALSTRPSPAAAPSTTSPRRAGLVTLCRCCRRQLCYLCLPASVVLLLSDRCLLSLPSCPPALRAAQCCHLLQPARHPGRPHDQRGALLRQFIETHALLGAGCCLHMNICVLAACDTGAPAQAC